MKPDIVAALMRLGEAMSSALRRFAEGFRQELELLELPSLACPRDVQFVPLMRQGRVSGVRAAKRSALKRQNQRSHRRRNQGKGRSRG